MKDMVLLQPILETDFCHTLFMRRKHLNVAHFQEERIKGVSTRRQGPSGGLLPAAYPIPSGYSTQYLIFCRHRNSKHALSILTFLIFVPSFHHQISLPILKLEISVSYFRICPLWLHFCLTS